MNLRLPDHLDEGGTLKIIVAAATALTCLAPGAAAARDDRLQFAVADALSTPAAKAKLDPRIRLYFGTQGALAGAKTVGEVSVNRKTNSFGKTDLEACQWVFLSVVLELQEQARKAGGNAVIEIVSNYKHEVRDSPAEFTCGAGAVIAGVALRGKVAKLPEPGAPQGEQR